MQQSQSEDVQPEASPEELAFFKRHVTSQYLYAERMLTTILNRRTFDRPCVIIDIDGTIIHPLKVNGIRELLPGVKKFFNHCQKSKVDVYFLTYRKEVHRGRTERLLKEAKLTPYKELIMHSDSESNTVNSKRIKMKTLVDAGNSIVMCIGDKITDLTVTTSCNVLISNPWFKSLPIEFSQPAISYNTQQNTKRGTVDDPYIEDSDIDAKSNIDYNDPIRMSSIDD